MSVLLITVFVASLVGSLHCVGMCGPFAILASTTNTRRESAILPAVAYSFGRLVTYTIVGLLFGLLGQILNHSTSAFSDSSFTAVQQTATYCAGGLMILVGLIALARHAGWQLRLPGIGAGMQTFLQNQYGWVTAQPPVRKALTIGALTCLMPCGWLYTFAIVAAGTASPIWGAVVMISFWAGTVPILFALATGFGRFGHSIQKRIPVAMATIVILIGVFTIAWRAPIAIGRDTTITTQTDELIQTIKLLDHKQMPCCAGAIEKP